MNTADTTFRTIPATIHRHKKLIASFTLVTFLLTAGYSFLAYKPQYTSSASVVIRDSALTANYLTNEQRSNTTAISSNSVLNTMELLKSDVIPEALWDQLLSRHLEEQKHLGIHNVDQWKGRFGDGKSYIKSKNIPGTDVIYLSFKWNSPKIAQEGMQAVLYGFQQASLEQNKLEHHQRYLYLRSQGEDLKTQLNNVRNKIANYKKTNKVYNLESALSQYEQTRNQINSSSKMASAEAQNYQSQLATYQGSLGMTPEKAVSAVAIGRSTTMSELYKKLYDLSEQRNALKPRYTQEHPKIKQLEAQIAQTRADIQQEISRNGITTGVKQKVNLDTSENAANFKSVPVIADETRSAAVKDMLEMKARFQGAKAQSAGLKHSLSEMEASMQKIPQVEATLADMKQEEAALSKSLDSIEEKALDAKIRETQTLSNVFLISKPTYPGGSQFPNQFQLLLFGLLAGLAGGIAAAYSLDLKNQKAKILPPDGISLDGLLAAERQAAEHQKNNIAQDLVFTNGEY